MTDLPNVLLFSPYVDFEKTHTITIPQSIVSHIQEGALMQDLCICDCSAWIQVSSRLLPFVDPLGFT